MDAKQEKIQQSFIRSLDQWLQENTGELPESDDENPGEAEVTQDQKKVFKGEQ